MRKVLNHRIVILVLFSLIASLFFPVTANAYINSLGKDGEIARGVAAHYWASKHSKRYRQSNCHPNQVHIYYYADPKSSRYARASIGGGMPDYNDTKGVCNMGINKAKIAGQQKAIFCAAIVHEYGHLLGYSHSFKPSSIMYYSFQPSHVQTSGCSKKYDARDVY